jgi:iron complex outermembrane receptor protein
MTQRRATLLAGAAIFGFALTVSAPFALAQDAPTQATDEATELDSIIVTGTRRLDRTVAESPVPVDVLSSEAISNQGFTETNRILNSLVPSFNFPQPSITDGTDVIRPATLRGLGPDQTLVLLNGKRRHVTALLNINGSVGRGTAAVDMNLIPPAAIERVEVLRDGAAAQYGSDAIAGVINVQLKRAREGGSVTVTYGQYVTTMDDVFNVTGVQRQANGEPVALPDGTFALITDGERTRRDGETITVAANAGLPLGAEGFVNLTAEYRDRGRTNRAGADPRRQFFQTAGVSDAREFTFNRFTHAYGDAGTEDVNVFVNAGLPINELVELYAYGNFGRRTGESNGFYRLPNAANNLIQVYPEGFLPEIATKLVDWSATGGAKGSVLDWNYDLSLGYARNKFDFRVNNSINVSLGPTSPNTFDSGGPRFEQFLVNLDLQRTFENELFRNGLSVAFGLEYRDETYKIRPGETNSFIQGPFVRVGSGTTQTLVSVPIGQALPAGGTRLAAGAQVFPGFRVPVDASRHNMSAYLDLETDIVENWTVSAALRYEDYSDFGSDWNWKVATRYALTDRIAIRGGYSTGFRAPSLHQQFFETITTQNLGGQLVDIATAPVSNPLAIALGAQPLRPERSKNLSVGLVLNPFDGFNITVDYYRISIDDRIVVSENLGVTSATPTATDTAILGVIRAAGFTNFNAARYFVNGVDTKTNGVDVIATYRVATDSIGTFNFTAAYNHNKTSVERIIAAPGPLAQIPGVIPFGRLESLRLEQGQPRDKVVFTADWEIANWGATLRATRFGRVLSPGGVNPPAANGGQIINGQPNRILWGDDVVLTPKTITDLEIRSKWFDDRVQVAFGANNLFDIYPDRQPTGARSANVGGGTFGTNNHFLPYSNFSPFGFNGRFLYGRISYAW